MRSRAMSTFRLHHSSVAGGGNNPTHHIYQHQQPNLCCGEFVGLRNRSSSSSTNNTTTNLTNTTNHLMSTGSGGGGSTFDMGDKGKGDTVSQAQGFAVTQTMVTVAEVAAGQDGKNLNILPLSLVAKKFNNFILDKDSPLPAQIELTSLLGLRKWKPFIVGGYQIGLISPKVLEGFKDYPSIFKISDEIVSLSEDLNCYESRSEALAKVLQDLKKRDMFVTLRGWRNECFEVRVSMDEPSIMQMERAATCLFGIRQFGVDITGYVNHPEKGLCIWLQKRSETKQRWPGMWDNMVGGGLAVGYSVIETAHKEAGEEASIPENLLKNLQPREAVSIFFESERGLSPNTEFVFDLELPLDFVPRNQDGEVSEFQLLTAKDTLKMVLSPSFKTTSCSVALDFLIRHGVLTDENEPELERVKQLLRIPLTDFYHKIAQDK